MISTRLQFMARSQPLYDSSSRTIDQLAMSLLVGIRYKLILVRMEPKATAELPTYLHAVLLIAHLSLYMIAAVIHYYIL